MVIVRDASPLDRSARRRAGRVGARWLGARHDALRPRGSHARLGIERGEERVSRGARPRSSPISWASISVANVADTFFLKRVGVDRLPWVFLLNSVLLTGTTFVVGRLALRYEPRRLLIATLGFLAVALVPLWMLVVGNVTSAFVLLRPRRQAARRDHAGRLLDGGRQAW